ncbi:MAG: hypothetical protein GX683_03100 [Ruminococcaceae bacterium]|nr:hypothetical protein [Oscillospiraceae bacterium]
MRKSIITVVASLLVILGLSGCDMKAGKRPSNYEGAVWTAQEIEMTFSVNEDNYEKCGANTYGWVTANGNTQSVFVLFDYGAKVFVMPESSYKTEIRDGKEVSYVLGDEYLFSGIWQIEKDGTSFTISVLENKSFLPDDVTEVTFIREDIE